MEESDEAAVAQARAGDQEGFRVLVDRHSRSVFRLAYRMTGNEHDAEDLVQEALLRAFKAFHGFRGADARAWLLAIVRNACYTWLRRARTGEVATVFDEESCGN